MPTTCMITIVYNKLYQICFVLDKKVTERGIKSMRRNFHDPQFPILPLLFGGDSVTGVSYLKMLNQFFYKYIVGKGIVSKTYFKQDRTPPHYVTDVREWLNKTFEGKWICRRGPIEWAAFLQT